MTLFSLQASILSPLSDVTDAPLLDAEAPNTETSEQTDDTPRAQRWIIIDGALIEHAEHTLLEQFVHSNKTSEYRNLFVGSKWQAVAEVGPVMLHYHPEIEAWAQAQRPWHFGLVFESCASSDELVAHWHQLISCQHLGLEGALCRLYDGMVLYHLLHQEDTSRTAKWLGPMNKIWLPDYVVEHYHYAERPELEDATPLAVTEFNDQEWQALSEAKRYATAYRLTQHVDQYFPDYWQDKDNKQQHIIEQLKHLEVRGPVTQQDAIHYMNIVCRLGDIWQQNTSYTADAVALLENQSVPMEERLQQVKQIATEYENAQVNNKEVTA